MPIRHCIKHWIFQITCYECNIYHVIHVKQGMLLIIWHSDCMCDHNVLKNSFHVSLFQQTTAYLHLVPYQRWPPQSACTMLHQWPLHGCCQHQTLSHFINSSCHLIWTHSLCTLTDNNWDVTHHKFSTARFLTCYSYVPLVVGNNHANCTTSF